MNMLREALERVEKRIDTAESVRMLTVAEVEVREFVRNVLAEAALRAETPAPRETQTTRVMDVHGAASETGDSQAGYPEAGSIPVGAVNILETRDFLLRELVTEWRYLAGEGERFDKDPVRRFRRDKDANYLVRESKRLRQCALQVENILLKSAAGELEQAK